MAHIRGCVPGGEHRDVVFIELRDRTGVVGVKLVIGNLVDPGANGLPEELAARLAADRIGDRADGVGGIDEVQGHDVAKIDPASDGTSVLAARTAPYADLCWAGRRFPSSTYRRTRVALGRSAPASESPWIASRCWSCRRPMTRPGSSASWSPRAARCSARQSRPSTASPMRSPRRPELRSD